MDSKPNIAERYYSENRKGRDDTIMACKILHTIFILAVLGVETVGSAGEVAQKQNIVKCFCRQDGDDFNES